MKAILKKISVAGTLAALGTCFNTPAYAVGNGIVDTGNQYPHVVRLNFASGYCSGTLITPFWVVSAKHCFLNDDGTLKNQNFSVSLTTDPDAASPATTFMHTTAVSGPVFVGSTVPNSTWDDDERSRDIAVFRLDTRVPRTLARPLHLPDEDACGSVFDGTIVGFGGDTDDILVCSDIPSLRRYSSSPLEYDRSHEDYGDIFYDTSIWTLVNWPWVCDEYEGSYGGDSGGPLLDDEGRLCGAVSGKTFGGALPGTYFLENVFAALDSGEARSFMLGAVTPAGNSIIDAKGNFDGECRRFVDECDRFGFCNETDTDVDGIIDVCDNCPTIANPEQATDPTDDADGDGLGNACDMCPTHVTDQWVGPATNCNFEAELAVSYPDATEPPIIRADSPTLAADLQLYRDTFRPNACDPVPCTKADLTQGGSLPAAEIPPVPNGQSSCPVWEPCHWELRNRINLKPVIGSVGANNTSGTLKLKWCDCRDHDTNTLAGRLACDLDSQTDCKRESAEFVSHPKWLNLSTKASGSSTGDNGWANGKSLGASYTLPFDRNPEHIKRTVDWDFLDLGANHVETGTYSRRVQGVLFSHLTSFSPVAGYNQTQAIQFGNYYFSGNASLIATNRPIIPPNAINLKDKYICPECPLGFTDLYQSHDPVINLPRIYRATPTGLALVSGLNADAASLYADAASGDVNLVTVAEPFRRLLRDQVPGDTLLRAVALDGADESELVAQVFSTKFDGPPLVAYAAGQGSSIPLNAPVLHGNEARVLSATTRRLLVIGGTVDGQPASQPNPSAWMLDVDSELWTEIPIPGSTLPGAVISATYRLEDRSVYLLDKVGGVLRLRRWQPQEEVETLAEFPVWWNDFQKYWLAPGEGGDLILAATSPITSPWNTASRAALARFTVNAGELGFAGLREMAIYLQGAPIVGVDNMSVSRLHPDSSISTTEVSLTTDFVTPSSTKMPTVF
ncbi:trypsin-like serine protease [Sorangium cellulosum]|uniref:trypsin-like serine protease n=1 Tax=Sorangium cellulosum TaxID=56 RepID=UPI0003F4CB42|nr:trypsin-like serine protease [Sorangium cellulosum]